jgi:hypothetical protein
LSKRPWRVDDFDDFLERVYGSSNSQQQQQLLDTATNAPAVAPASAGSSQGAQQVQQQMQQLQLQAAAQQQAEQQQHTADDPATQLLASTTESPFCNASAVAAAASGQAGSSSATAPATNSSSSSACTHHQQQQQQQAGVQPQQPPFRRVMVFVDNAGADIVLGMLPFVREMLRLGCEVVMVANSLPAINDITAAELRRCGLGPSMGHKHSGYALRFSCGHCMLLLGTLQAGWHTQHHVQDLHLRQPVFELHAALMQVISIAVTCLSQLSLAAAA